MSGWFDRFSKQEITRKIDIDGIVSYSINISNHKKRGDFEYIDTIIEPIELFPMYYEYLKLSKKTLTPELKQVIDDIPIANIDTIWGVSDYSQKPLIGHAIDEINVEAVNYLLQKGANVNISGTNQHHILQELLASNATEKRLQILEIVLKKLKPNTVKITKGFDGKFYSIKYLIPLINSSQLNTETIEMIYKKSTPKQKKMLINNCNTVIPFIEEEFMPPEVRDIFMF